VKDKKKIKGMSDSDSVELFKQVSSIEEKLQHFSRIQDDNCKMELLNSIPENERYKFIGKLKSSANIATAINSLSDGKTKSRTFNFVAKQFKGNSIGLLEIMVKINFDVSIPKNMLTFKLNNINALNLNFLINIQQHVRNYSEMKFKINESESNDSMHIEYSFSEISAIIAKIEELSADIPKDMDEANKFYKIYSRITGMMTYDYSYIRKDENARSKLYDRKYSMSDYDRESNRLRKNPSGLYGGLIEGKAICAGYALILNQALKYVGLKSQYVKGFALGEDGHAWNQVQIDGKWYNSDPTWDSQENQFYRRYEHMLLNDEDFNQTHGKFSFVRTKTEHKCNNRFDYSKIQGLLPSQIKSAERREHAL